MANNYVFQGGITRYWWIPLITGILSIVIGIWCFCAPVESMITLAYVFAGILCATGIFNLAFAFSNTRLFPMWGWSLCLGILELMCGVWMFCLPPAAMTVVFIYAIGFYLIFAAINAICESCTFYGYSTDWFGWILAILLVTLFFAVLFMTGPVAGGIAVWMYIGISFILFGIYRLIYSAKIRKFNRTIRF